MNRLKKAVTGKSSKSSATDAHVADNHVVVHGDGFADAPEVRGLLPPPSRFARPNPTAGCGLLACFRTVQQGL